MTLISRIVLPGVLVSTSAGAVSPATWRTSGVDGWNATERQSVGVTSEGTVQLAREALAVEGLSEFVVWDLLEEDGRLLAATGDGGGIFRIGKDGKAVEVTRVVQPEITALGRDGAGRVLFGAAPDGVLYRLDGDDAVPVADTPETYIWKILPDGGKGAVIATGDSGKLYRVSADGKVDLLAETGCVHVTGLVKEGDGFLATTESPGRLLRVNASGEITVLHDAEEAELRAPVIGSDGSVTFLANPEGTEPGRVYRRSATGAVERLWTSLGGFLYTLLALPGGALLVGAGGETEPGSVFRLEPGPPTAWLELVHVTEPQVVSLHAGAGGEILFGTGGLGRLYRLPGADSGSGTATSIVHDAGGTARWGAVGVDPGYLASGLRLETRSGNTKDPDDTWSAWTATTLEEGRGPVQSPSARFLQWRLTLSQSATRIAAVHATYLPANLAPRVNEVAVADLGGDFGRSQDSGPPPALSQDLPGGVRVEFQIPNYRPEGDATDSEAVWARRYRTVSWKAQDPNSDPLRYDLALRGNEEASWQTLEKDIESSVWVWDSATVPDGWYQLRVTATDREANPPGEERTGNRDTDPFLVDNTPPAVTGLRVSGLELSGTAEDASSAIKKIEVAVDGQGWRMAFPEDGIPDMPHEAFRLTLSNPDPGEHTALVRVTDWAGNIGTGRVAFRVP